MKFDTIKIGVIGAGNAAVTRQIPAFQTISGVDVVGVVNRTLESSKEVAFRLGIPKVYESWVTLMDDPEIDAVFIGTWPYMHRTLVVEALCHDKHVLTQARMANNLAEANEMRAVSLQKPHLIAQVYPSRLFSEYLMRTMTIMIRGGTLGEVLSADYTDRKGFQSADRQFTWRHDIDLSGFNALMVGARYESLMEILGPVSSVSAVTKVVYPLLSDGVGGKRVTNIPDYVEVLAELVGGGVLRMNLSSVVGLASPSALWVFGTDATIRCMPSPVDEIWWGYRDDKELTLFDKRDQLGDNIGPESAFINAIRGNGSGNGTSFEVGVKYMEFSEAVVRSARENRTMYLPL